jgi:hypothetical protein
MGQADMILVRFFPNQILLEVNMVNLSVFLPEHRFPTKKKRNFGTSM